MSVWPLELRHHMGLHCGTKELSYLYEYIEHKLLIRFASQSHHHTHSNTCRFDIQVEVIYHSEWYFGFMIKLPWLVDDGLSVVSYMAVLALEGGWKIPIEWEAEGIFKLTSRMMLSISIIYNITNTRLLVSRFTVNIHGYVCNTQIIIQSIIIFVGVPTIF